MDLLGSPRVRGFLEFVIGHTELVRVNREEEPVLSVAEPNKTTH